MNFIKSVIEFFYQKTGNVNNIEDSVDGNKKKRKSAFEEQPTTKRQKMSEEQTFREQVDKSSDSENVIVAESAQLLNNHNEIIDLDELDDSNFNNISTKPNFSDFTQKPKYKNEDEHYCEQEKNEKVFDDNFLLRISTYPPYQLNLSSDQYEDELSNEYDDYDELDETYEEEDDDLGEEEESILSSIRNLFSPKINWSLIHWEENRTKRQSEISGSYGKLKTTAEQYKKHILLNKIKEANQRKITKEEENRFFKTLRGNGNDILLTAFNIELKRKDFGLLYGNNWLGDEVINFYFNLLKEREKVIPGIPKCHFFSTFFYGMLFYDSFRYNYQRVRRWTSKIDIFSFDKVIIPLHLGNHWALAVLNIQNKRIEYYDSMNSRNNECMEAMKRYIVDEYLDKKKETIDIEEWTLYYPRVPKQENGWDCGVFTCKFAEYTSCNLDFDFNQSNMPSFRIQIGIRILDQSCL